jgi:Tfp pilus assembly protein PilV
MQITHSSKKAKAEKGFMLPDVILAIFVTTTALVAILAAVVPALKAEFYKRDQIIATGLAQEGIELVRNVRDNNWKSTPAKRAFDVPFALTGEKTTCIDSSMANLDRGSEFPSCGGGKDVLYREISSGRYYAGSRSGATRTQFSRTVTITPGSGTTAHNAPRTVTSKVTWTRGTSTYEVSLSDTLSAWGNQ